MHDLLKFASLAQTLSSGQNLMRSIVYFGIAVIVFFLWIQDELWARVISFAAVDVALYFAVIIFLSNPLEFIKVLSLKIFLFFLSLLRIGIKFILLALAGILSVVYFAFPIDFIPDILLGFGWIDDALVAIGLFSWAANSDLQFPEPRLNSYNSYPVFTGLLAASISTGLTYFARVLTS